MRRLDLFLPLLALLGACGNDGSDIASREPGTRTFSVEHIVELSDDSSAILARPEWISILPNGHVAVTDISDKNLKIYDPEGHRIGTVGRVGQGPGEFVALMTAQSYRDSLVGYDLTGRRLSIFDSSGRFARAMALGPRYGGTPFHIRVVDDSLFLLIAAVPGTAGRDLLTLVRPDGRIVSRFFNPSGYLGTEPALIQLTGAVADGAAGTVFAALIGGDSIYAFDYGGRRLGSHPVDPERPLVTTRQLLEENRGRAYRADRTHVTHGNRNVIRLVALDSGTVAMQVVPYDAVRGVDPLDGGTLIAAALRPGGGFSLIAREELTGALLGRDREWRALLLRYASDSADRYALMRVTLDSGTREGEP